MVTLKTIGIDAKWQAEDDLRTLTRAKEIEADRKRMAAAQKVGQAKIKEMQSVVKKAVPKPIMRRK